MTADLHRGCTRLNSSNLQPHPSVCPRPAELYGDVPPGGQAPGEEDREGGISVKSLWALRSPVKSLTGCPLSSCSSLGCPWSRVASTRPAASAWAQATLTVDGVSFTTRKYLLVFATVPAPLFCQPSSLNGCDDTWQRCKMLSRSLAELGEPKSHPGTSSKGSGTCWGRLRLTEKRFLEDKGREGW